MKRNVLVFETPKHFSVKTSKNLYVCQMKDFFFLEN